MKSSTFQSVHLAASLENSALRRVLNFFLSLASSFPEATSFPGPFDAIGSFADEELAEADKDKFFTTSFDFDTIISSSFCSCIPFAIVEQLCKRKFWAQQRELTWLMLNRWRRLFQSSRVCKDRIAGKLPRQMKGRNYVNFLNLNHWAILRKKLEGNLFGNPKVGNKKWQHNFHLSSAVVLHMKSLFDRKKDLRPKLHGQYGCLRREHLSLEYIFEFHTSSSSSSFQDYMENSPRINSWSPWNSCSKWLKIDRRSERNL